MWLASLIAVALHAQNLSVRPASLNLNPGQRVTLHITLKPTQVEASDPHTLLELAPNGLLTVQAPPYSKDLSILIRSRDEFVVVPVRVVDSRDRATNSEPTTNARIATAPRQRATGPETGTSPQHPPTHESCEPADRNPRLSRSTTQEECEEWPLSSVEYFACRHTLGCVARWRWNGRCLFQPGAVHRHRSHRGKSPRR